MGRGGGCGVGGVGCVGWGGVGWGGVLWCWGWVGWGGDIRIPSDGILNTDEDHTLCDKEFEGKGAVVGREEKLFNQHICQPIC